MGTWAKGIDFKNSTDTVRIGGIGIYGTDTVVEKLYFGLGSEPWNITGLEVTNNEISFKGNNIYHAGNKPTLLELGASASNHTHDYIPLSGGTITGTISSTLSTATHIAGNKGTAIINSSAAGSGYNMLAKMNSTNGVWTFGSWGTNFDLFYTDNSVITAGTNTYTKMLVLLNESGNSSFPGVVTASSFSGALSGNASTASTLQTSRSINGTSFNGSGDITTARWGTARTITLGNTGKSINGSADISWSLTEIGAAAATHTHSYLPLSGGTVTGDFIVNSSKVPALATKVSSCELFTTKITVAGDYAAWANQTALSGVIITQNGITTPGISSGAIDASGESTFFNQTYSDPWNGTSCAIKATGYIASTHSIMSKGRFILGNSPSMYGGLGYDTTSGDVYVSNAVNNWLRLRSDQTMAYAGYEVFTTKDRGDIMTVATRISNLNVKLNSGWYAWSSNATGRPADYGVMLVIQWGSEGDFCQIAVSTGNSMWTRWYVNSAWTSWIGH